MLEREGEPAAAQAAKEQGGVLLIEGGAGIDKTSLLAAACQRAAELGREVLRARAPSRRPASPWACCASHSSSEAYLAGDERDAAHRAATCLLHADGAPAGRVAAQPLTVQPSGDAWVVARCVKPLRKPPRQPSSGPRSANVTLAVAGGS